MKALTKDKSGRALNKQATILAEGLLMLAVWPAGVSLGPDFMQTAAIETLRDAGLYELVTKARLKKWDAKH